MVPTTFLLFHELPLKPNGKLDLDALEDAKPDSTTVQGDTPLSSTESRVLQIMHEILRHDALQPDADFFEAGGDSLLAITLMSRLDDEFGKKLPARVLDGVFNARRLASILESPLGLHTTYPPSVVQFKGGTNYKPLFCMPGVYATAFEFRTLATKLRTRRPILAIQLSDLLTGPSALESIEDMAKAIVERLREADPIGPYAIMGYSFGGNLAVEVARQLTARDQKVELVVILDSSVPPMLRKGLSKKIVRLLQIIVSQTLQDSYAYISSRIQHRLFLALPKSDTERRMVEAYEHCMRAFHAHRPKPFSGRIVLVQAKDFGNRKEDPSGTNGWSSLCKGGVDVIRMDCRHLDLMNEPHIAELARHIDGLLTALDS
jgi:thioesterase domain-containing protein/acyl carrier protein